MLSLTAGCHPSPLLSPFVLSLVTFSEIPRIQPQPILTWPSYDWQVRLQYSLLAQTGDLQVQAISILSQVHSVMFSSTKYLLVMNEPTALVL